MGHLVKCAEIFWCSQTGQVQYKCSVCLQSFDTHPKCLSHVRPCPKLKPKQPPKEMVILPVHRPVEFVNAGGSVSQFIEPDRASPYVSVKIKEEPGEEEEPFEDTYFSDGDHFVDEVTEDIEIEPMKIKHEPSSESPAAKVKSPDPIQVPKTFLKAVKKPSDIKWLDKMPAAYETITKGQIEFNAILRKGLRKGKNMKLLTCDICDAQRLTRNHMLQHMSMHINAKLFKCRYCTDKAFNTKKLLWFHIKHMHLRVEERNSVTCTICGATFRSDYSLRVHHRMHSGERPFACTQCDRRFFAKSYLKKHIKKHEVKVEPPPPATEKELALSWVTSMQEVRDELPPDEKHFTYTLLRGIKGNRKGNTIECDICGSMQESRRRMVKHMAMHINAKQFQCILCDRSFNTKGLLKMHVKHMHVQKEDLDTVFECDLCTAPFKTQSAMRSHRIIHTRSAEHKCVQCDKVFMKKRHLEEHARRHDMLTVTADGECAVDCTWIDEIPKIHEDQSFGEKQFSSMLLKTLRHAPNGGSKYIQCDICGSMQESRYRMMRHMAMHINARNFKCILCEKAFNTKKLLMLHVKHMHKHGPPKTFVCEFCAAQFRSEGGLKVHRRIHTNEKPYSCEYCGKSFNYLKSKKQHMRIHCVATDVTPRPDIEILQRWLAQLPDTTEEATLEEKNFSCMLLRQLRKGRSGKILECELCGSLQDLRKDMLHHMAMHIDAKMYSCIVCGKAFNSKHQLAGHVTHMHMESMAAESSAGHACELCPMVFGSSGGLTKHRRVHAREIAQTVIIKPDPQQFSSSLDLRATEPTVITEPEPPQFTMPLEIQWS